MPRSATSDLGLHCFNMSHKKDARRTYVKVLIKDIYTLSALSFFRFVGMATLKLKKIFEDATELTSFFLNIFLHLFYTILVTMLNRSSKLTPSYERSATIHRILWKRKWIEVAECTPGDFLTWPISNIHPKYILNRNVSLYAITKDVAVFVETPECIDIHRSDVHPFLYMAQFVQCKRVITIPIQFFHRLAGEIGDPSCQVILLSNTGRCGSTIVGQIIESVPGTLLMSEPDALTNLAYMRVARVLTNDEQDKWLQSVIRVICKPHDPNTVRICIKPRFAAMIQMKSLFRLFPDMNQMFLYRNSLETISSFLNFSANRPSQKIFRFCADSDRIAAVCTYPRAFSIHILGIGQENQFKDPKAMDTYEMFATLWASALCLAKQLKSSNNDLLLLKYEDLIDNPYKFCSDLFKAVDIDISEVNNALSALEKDSQEGTMLAERSTGKDTWRHLTIDSIRKANIILSMYKLPPLGKDFRI